MNIYETIDSCRICHSGDLSLILDLGDQPPANSLRAQLDEPLPNVPLVIVRCGDCGAIQLRETVDPTYLFKDYVWVTGTSQTAEQYSRQFYSEATNRGLGEGFVVEVASNDGTFLRRFVEGGFRVLGVDPAQNIADQACVAGIPTVPEFFSVPLSEDILKEHSTAQYVIARNVIPHVKDVRSVIEGMARLLDPISGVGIIEFHYAKAILDELHYDSIYHEHLLYLTGGSLNRLINESGMHIFDVGKSPISGGSLVAYFSKSPRSPSANWLEILEEEEIQGVNSLQRWQEFASGCEQHARRLKDLVENEIAKENNLLVGYGASARSSTLLNYCKINNSHLSAVIDKSPLKVGKYTPGSNIPIIGFDDGISQIMNGNNTLLLLAWNFEKEIVDSLIKRGVRCPIIVPLPNEPRQYEVH